MAKSQVEGSQHQFLFPLFTIGYFVSVGHNGFFIELGVNS